MSSNGIRADIARHLMDAWSERRFNPVFTSAGLRIDLERPEGQWLLLVLALLYAAKVKRVYAERTFLALRDLGLLELGRMVEGVPEDKALMLGILKREYRGLISKDRKMESLFLNAALVGREWHGRPLEYLRSLPEEKVTQELSRLKLFGATAYWYCREAYHLGAWPEVPTELTLYVDASLRLAMVRLGLINSKVTKPWDLTVNECRQAIREWFQGDCLSLYRQGRYLCELDNPRLCLEECPVRGYCLLWR